MFLNTHESTDMCPNLHRPCLEGEVEGEPTRATGTCAQVTNGVLVPAFLTSQGGEMPLVC